MSHRPDASEYASFFAGYVALVPEDDVLGVLAAQAGEVQRLAQAVPADRETFRYQPGKWSVRDIFGHIIDGERVFGYRAFSFSRGEAQALPGFDEKEYVAAGGAGQTPVADLAAEFAAVRDANLRVFRRLDDAAWQRVGNASGKDVSVRALAVIMAGHVRHHLKVLGERYGVRSAA